MEVAGQQKHHPAPAFELLKAVEFVVPAEYCHDGFLGRLRETEDPKRYFFNDSMTDENYPRPSRIVKAGDRFAVKFVAILRQVTSDQCMGVYREHNANFTGAQGAGLLYQYLRKELPVGKWTLSFDEKSKLWKDAGGYHRVPSVDRNSDGYFELCLGYFEKPWDGHYVLALFCDLPCQGGAEETSGAYPPA